uniref:Uncharacterized protein n=1 Tax=Moniliophthora roreri TaxID=221103 RepID=A0A0W0FLL2_MONRR
MSQLSLRHFNHLVPLVVSSHLQRLYEGMSSNFFRLLSIALLSLFDIQEQALYYYLYFFFCGFHLLFSVYMIIGIPSTGSAGLIQTVQMFVGHHWAAAVLGLVASIGWLLQGLGNAFYYRQIYAHHTAAGHTMEKAKTELATHGAKAYFTRG